MAQRRWYLVHAKPFGESTVCINLARQGFECYWPRLARHAWVRGIERMRIGSLFPRYLFVRVEEGRQSLSSVHSTVGVSKVVRFGSSYAVVPDQVIADLQGRADPQSGLHRLSRPLLAPGMPMRIATPPFRSIDAVFERKDGRDRAIVLLELLGQSAPINVPLRLLEPLRAT